MDKHQVSCRINRYTGGDPDEMFCARVHVQQRLWGGFWLPLGSTIDVAFYLIRRQRQHVRATYISQRRWYAKAKVQAHESATEEAEEPPTRHETRSAESETRPCTNCITTTSSVS